VTCLVSGRADEKKGHEGLPDMIGANLTDRYLDSGFPAELR
jgi:hypothetical protein